MTITQQEWDSKTFIKIEMHRQFSHRYLAIKKLDNNTEPLIRYLTAFNIHTFNISLERFNAYTSPYRAYYTLAQYKKPMTVFSFNIQERDRQKEAFQYKKDTEIISLDFAIDLDADIKKGQTIEQPKEEAIKITNLYTKHQIPYSIRFSGTKGFHITIQAHNMPRSINHTWDQQANLYYKIAMKIKNKLKLKTLDPSIYDTERILKLPYSMDGKSGKICLPLTDQQLHTFTPETASPEHILKHIKIKNRGLLWREGEPDNMKKMMKGGMNEI